MSERPAVEVRGLSHAFDGRTVLHEIDFDVRPGEILAIMGSSGGGKTTLLKCIAGLLKPTQGRVLVDGIDSGTQPDQARKKLGLVFQSAALFDSLNVADNVLFGVRRAKHPSRAEEKRILEEALQRVHLAGSENLMPSELSGGMRKRVGLARALAMEPQVLLYDEPTSGLDPITTYSIDALIVETRDRLGVAGIVVSHDVSSVMRVAERIAFLEQGRLTFMGTPTEFGTSRNAAISEMVRKAQAQELSESH